MAFYCFSTPLASSTSLITTTSLLSTSSTSSSRNYNFRSRCLTSFNLQSLIISRNSWNMRRRGRKQIVRMAPDEEKMTRRSPLDFPIHKPKPSRIPRPKVFAFYGLTDPPYKLDALEPYMSQRTLELHWGEYHCSYVEGLNRQLKNNNPLYGCTMEELVKVTYNNGNPLPEFNNAAQVWNHDFFWESMQPGGGSIPGEGVLKQIEKDFGSFTNFKEKFTEAAQTLFGSGWIWLVLKPREKRLAVVKTSNAVNPLVWDDIPIISLDMWEHAYYTDYKNDKGKYVNVFMDKLVSWHAATTRMARAEAFVNLGEPNIPVA